MSVQNRIVKIQKRNRALSTFDPGRICRAILRAAESIGGFGRDYLAGVNDRIFAAWTREDELARFLADAVVVCLNTNPHHLIANFPPTIETIQDAVLHTLRSYGFQNTADAYECYRWGRHWLREGAITQAQFVGNGLPTKPFKTSSSPNTVAELNGMVRGGKLKQLVSESLAAYERELDTAAENIIGRLKGPEKLRMIWISGPSSSGKTTTTVKLTQRLQKQGLQFLMLNLDDYFWSLVEHPTDWINDRNYETPEAIDIQLLNRHLLELLSGRAIEKPVYSFKEGRQIASKRIQLEPGQVLLLDCLHGLYPPITEGISASAQFRVYIDTEIDLYENHETDPQRIRSTDIRLMRRVLRDARFRNHNPLLTILHWHYVRAGELFSIIPLRGLADCTVHAGFAFELPALKTWLWGAQGFLPAPEELDKYSGFLDAQTRYQKVRKLLDSLEGLTRAEVDSHNIIPGDALIREFIGGSTIKIPHNE